MSYEKFCAGCENTFPAGEVSCPHCGAACPNDNPGGTLPAGTYPGQTEEVQTVGVKAVLLASNALPAKQVQQLTQLLFSSREGLEEQLGIPLDPEENAVEGVGIPFHAGAAAYYKAAGITVDQTAGN